MVREWRICRGFAAKPPYLKVNFFVEYVSFEISLFRFVGRCRKRIGVAFLFAPLRKGEGDPFAILDLCAASIC